MSKLQRIKTDYEVNQVYKDAAKAGRNLIHSLKIKIGEYDEQYEGEDIIIQKLKEIIKTAQEYLDHLSDPIDELNEKIENIKQEQKEKEEQETQKILIDKQKEIERIQKIKRFTCSEDISDLFKDDLTEKIKKMLINEIDIKYSIKINEIIEQLKKEMIDKHRQLNQEYNNRIFNYLQNAMFYLKQQAPEDVYLITSRDLIINDYENELDIDQFI